MSLCFMCMSWLLFMVLLVGLVEFEIDDYGIVFVWWDKVVDL